MKHNIFRYITIAAALLATAVNAGAQYNYAGGVGTSKTATQIDAETYKIRLETFATGTTTVTESATPVDVVLVLDVSGSMAWPKGTATQTSKTTFSYNDIVNSDTDYFRSFRNYTEQIYGYTDGTYYYLYVSPDITSKNYLTEEGGTTQNLNNAARSTDPNAILVTTYKARTSYYYNDGWDNRSSFFEGSSRINALKDAIGAFIDEIELNDLKDKDGNDRETRLGNRISIVKFASETRNSVGNDEYNTGGNTYNYTQIINHFLPTEGNVETMKASVNALVARGGTSAGAGMDLANQELLNAKSGSNKVVIMFTDGVPDDDYDAIGKANTTKNERNAKVFSIGVFDVTPTPGNNPPRTGSNVWRYMNYVSSNYPNATGINSEGNGGDYTAGYYQDASSTSADLTSIFVAIAQGIGGSTEPIGTETQVRDVVTNSFVLPNTVTAADVHVYTSAATGDASGTDETNPAGWATPVDITSSVTPTIVNVDADGNPTDDATKVKNKALFVEGFDYSKDDTNEGDGDGNWVGVRLKNNRYFWAGKKLIIEFKVKADPEATGGETLTNTGKSGVYIKNEDGTYDCINYYEQPHQTLTVNIKIRKTGLRHGESATFELMKIRPKGWDESKTVAENIENIEYNFIGKPIPGTKETTLPKPTTGSDWSDYYKDMGWESFKKVILTNKGANGAEVVKDVLVLDPYWVYLVLEDDWGWAYTMTGDTNQVGEDGTYTTSSVEVNPFRFHNTEDPNAVKHAEAIMINHFKSSLSGSKVEHDKSSKVESF